MLLAYRSVTDEEGREDINQIRFEVLQEYYEHRRTQTCFTGGAKREIQSTARAKFEKKKMVSKTPFLGDWV